MYLETLPVLRIVLILFAQFIVAGGLAAFAIVSRMHEEKVFPREMRGGLVPRLMHRDRLQLILILIGLDVLTVVFAALPLYRIIRESGAFGGSAWLSSVLTGIVIAAIVTGVTMAGLIAATRDPRRFAIVVSYPMLPFYLVLKLPIAAFVRIVSLIFPFFLREIASPFFLFPEGDEGSEGFIEENGGRLMHSIFEFGVKKVREVMVPRVDVFALDIHSSVDEVREKVYRAGHSRVPVYDGSIDRIAGILYVKDLVWNSRERGADVDLGAFLRDAYYVPESKKIDELLREFQLEKKHIAVVVDEYGGTSGIVTLEDILEEIVGEIRDEYDQEAPLIRTIGENRYAVAGRMNIGELNEALKVAIPSEEVDTLGGFLYNLIGRVPTEGETVSYENIDFAVSRLDGQRISEVILTLPPRQQRGSAP